MRLFYSSGVYPQVREAKPLGIFTVSAIAAICSHTSATAAIDLNSNGICDIWEQKYNATALVVDTAAKEDVHILYVHISCRQVANLPYFEHARHPASKPTESRAPSTGPLICHHRTPHPLHSAGRVFSLT